MCMYFLYVNVIDFFSSCIYLKNYYIYWCFTLVIFFVKRLEICFKRYINVIYYYYYYLFIVKRFDHIIGKRYISTCYVGMYVRSIFGDFA